MAEKSHHTKIREDFFTHPKTAKLSPVARCVWLYACVHPYLGVVRQSKRMIAKAIGSSEDEVSIAIHQLQHDGLVVWWDDLETLWLRERASENCTNQNFWKGCEKEAAALPSPIRDAISERYASSWGQGLGQPLGQGLSPCYVYGDVMPMVGEHEDAECAKVADGLAWIVPAGRKRLLYRDERVRPLVRAGATADEILDVVRRLAEAVESGAESADRWTATYVFSGWFDRLRDQPAHSEGGRL